MAKININFNDSTYQIDESSLIPATTAFQSHLLMNMSGTGATIMFGGTTYNIDSTKLAAAKNELVSHLGAITGEGIVVTVDGVEHNVDSTKLAEAVSNLSTTFEELENTTTTSNFILSDGSTLLTSDGQLFMVAEPTTYELSGTWVFNDSPAMLADTYTVNFISNGAEFTKLTGSDDPSSLPTHNMGRIWYYNGSWVNVHNGSSWTNSAYKTITITSTLAEVENGDALLAWLRANATKQGAPSLISFTIAGTTYQAEEGMTWYEWVQSDYSPDSYSCESTESNVYPTGDTYVADSEGNAVIGSTLITEGGVYSIEEVITEDALAGTWVFTSPAFTIPYEFYNKCGQRIYVHFVSNGRSFNYIEYNDTGSGTSGDELYYDMRLVIEGGQTSQGAWISDGYKTVNIESKLSEVTNGSALLTWLQANATKQSSTTVSTITFTIDGTSYEAEEGMTWAEWVESEYNTNNYTTLLLDGVVTVLIELASVIAHGYGLSYNDTFVPIGDTIVADRAYIRKYGAHSGGSSE